MKIKTKLKIETNFRYGLLIDFAFIKGQYLTQDSLLRKLIQKIFFGIKSVSEYTVTHLENNYKSKGIKIACFQK